MTQVAVSDFEKFRAMQAQLHREETEAMEARLISDGTWQTVLESYAPIDAERLPNAQVVGYRLCFNVDEHGVTKKHWINVYFTPVTNAKGLVLQSKLGAQLAQVVGMGEDDTFETMLDRAKVIPVMQRITKKAASGGFKAGNTTWQISAVS